MAVTQVRTAALFTATDHCDRCPWQATTRAILHSGRDLQFCDHHLRRYRTTLTPLTARFERHVDLAEALAVLP